ncbi:MAG: hypothetical protein WA970_04630, partial [Gammaproteobacteria bacterium]
VKRLGYTRKKKTFHATERDEYEEVPAARCAYREGQPALDTRKLVFVDECGTQLQMTRACVARPEDNEPRGQNRLMARTRASLARWD